MNKNKKQQRWAYFGLGAICLLFIGILINIIGNVSIRSNDTTITRIGMHIVSPLQAGEQTVIRWDTPSSVPSQQAQVAVRSKQGVQVLKETPFFAGTASIQIPCSIPEGSASIEILSAADKSVIAWQNITVSAAGPDCAR